MPAGPETVTATFTTAAQRRRPPVLTISKTHVGNFTVGDTGDTYTVTVSNTAGAGPTSGTVTVTDTIPSGLIAGFDGRDGLDVRCGEQRLHAQRRAGGWGELSGDYSDGGCV